MFFVVPVKNYIILIYLIKDILKRLINQHLKG